MLIASLFNCTKQRSPLSPEVAREELKRRGIEYSTKAFVESFTKGNADAMMIFLDAGMDPNVRGESGQTALMKMAYSGDNSSVSLLLTRGADLKLADDEGLTALHWAARSPFGYKSVNVLLDYGAEPNARTRSGNTPLHEAMISPLSDSSEGFLLENCADTITTLIERGANVNAKNDRGITPLMRAAISGSPRIVRLLIDRDADVTASDSQGKTARMYGLEYGQTDAARVIEQSGG